MARNSGQTYLPESGAAQQITALKGRLMQAFLVTVLGGALFWVWWRRRLEDLWQHPQHAPLSAQWLKPT